MPERTLKLGAVLMGVGGPGQQNTWLDPDVPTNASVDIWWYIARAQEAEAAKFDFIFIADSQFITADSPNHYLSRLEPLTLLSAVAVHTRNLGLVATASSSYNSPFNLARRFASLDHISGGRAAQGLWDSYEGDAFPRDRETGVFVDPTKQHALEHVGEFFSVVGPLNLERAPQGQPVIFQAGDSEEGRDLGAEIGEAIFAMHRTLEEAIAFRTEMRARAADKGRDPDTILIFPALNPIIGATDEQARARETAILGAKSFERALAELGRPFGWHDFSQYDPDAPFPELPQEVGQNAFRTQAESIKRLARENGLTLRQVVHQQIDAGRSPFVGSPETVADEIERWFEAGAFDGINFFATTPADFTLFLTEVVPILRDRGTVRSDYDAATLRGNLGLPVPVNRYAASRVPAGSP